MSIACRKVEIAVRISEPTEVSAVALITWYPDIRVLAMRSYCDREGVVLLLVTTNPTKASQVLETSGFRCKASPVVLIGPLDRSGLASPIGLELARMGIEVLYSYSSRTESVKQYLVFKTTEDDRALRVFAISPTLQQATGNEYRQNQGTCAANQLSLCQVAA
jgi:hypothetical protein